MKRPERILFVGLILASCVSVVSFYLQVKDIHRRVKLAERQDTILMVCTPVTEIAYFHGAAVFGVFSAASVLWWVLSRRGIGAPGESDLGVGSS
jgi:hypothetical protein